MGFQRLLSPQTERMQRPGSGNLTDTSAEEDSVSAWLG